MIYVNIEKKFKGFYLKTEFEFKNGILGLLGASGSGKSLTLKCIAGIEKPDFGKIVLNGKVLFDSSKDIDISTKNRNVGYLFQDYALFPNMNVYDNIKAGIRDLQILKNKKKSEELIFSKMEEMRIDHLKYKRISEISGGEKQRVALSRMLINKPNIILLDEPFSALDDFLKWKIELEINDILKKYDIPAVFVSHNREEMYRFCDEICVMNKGVSEKVLSKEVLFKSPNTLSACLLSGCKNYSKFVKISQNKIFAQDWGIELEAEQKFYENYNVVAIRSHYIDFVDNKIKNSFEVEIYKEVEDLFSYIIMVKFKNDKSSLIRIDIDKSKWEALRGNDKFYILLNVEKLIFVNE